MTIAREKLSVVVLTSVPLEVEVTSALRALPEVGRVHLEVDIPRNRPVSCALESQPSESDLSSLLEMRPSRCSCPSGLEPEGGR